LVRYKYRKLIPPTRHKPLNSKLINEYSILNSGTWKRKAAPISFLYKLQRKETASCTGGNRLPSPLPSPDVPASHSSSGFLAIDGALSGSSFQSDLEDLYISIVDHVRSYYISGPTAMVPSQGEIEVLIAEMSIPWPQIRLLLKDPENRHGVLVLCIAWVTLSRCLLLESGVCSSPSNSFLPPEIVMPSPLRPRSAGAP
jgi:hypothetical protein